MNKKLLWLVYLMGIDMFAMDCTVAPSYLTESHVMEAYYYRIEPIIDQLNMFGMRFEYCCTKGNIHGVLYTLKVIRRLGFRLLREYHRLECHILESGTSRSVYTPARLCIRQFIEYFAPWMGEQIEEFFSGNVLANIFIKEQIDWTEPFIALQNLVQDEERVVAPPSTSEQITPLDEHIAALSVEDEPCAGIGLADSETTSGQENARACCWCCLHVGHDSK